VRNAAEAAQLSNVERVRRAFDAWRNGTGSPFELLADDATWTIVGHSDAAKVYGSRKDFMSQVIEPFNARMRSGLKPNVHATYVDGDTVIVLFDARGVARDGLEYTNTYAWFLQFSAGRVTRATAFFDSLAFNDLWRRVSPA
jgi:ketosteroid isomerase-like protein